MAQQIIDIDIPDSGNGDPLYDAGDKINDNFTELYAAKVTTIGTGGDYATIGAAVAAGKFGIFVLISNVTETGNTSLITGNEGAFYVFSSGNFTWSLSTFTFAYRAYKYIYCNVTNPNFIDNSVFSRAFIYSKSVTLSSTAIYYVNLFGCNCTLPNATFNFNSGVIENCELTGGGSSTKLQPQGSKLIRNKLLGTWAAASIDFLTTANPVFVGNYGTITGTVYFANNAELYAEISGNQLPNMTISFNSITGTLIYRLSNSVFAAISTSAAVLNKIIDVVECRFTTMTTLPNGQITYNSCLFDNSITIAIDDTTLIACRIGVPGGGAKKITINAGVNDTIIRDLRTEAATTDGGTGSVITEKIW